VRAQLIALGRLAEVDQASAALETELSEIPTKLDALRKGIELLSGLLTKERQELSDAEKLRAEHEQEITERQEQLSRSRLRATKAKNTRESEALEQELSFIRKSIKDKEDERTNLSGAIERVASSVAQHEQELTDARKLVEEEEEKARGRVAELQKELERVTVGRSSFVEQIDKDLYRRYEMFRRKIGSAVAFVNNGTCSGCRMSVPSQQYNMVLRGETVEQCRHCLRVFVHPSWLEEASS